MLATLLALSLSALAAGPEVLTVENADVSRGHAGWKGKRTRGVTCDVDPKTGHDAPGSLRVLSTDPDGNGSWTQCVDVSARHGQLLRVSGDLRTRGASGQLVLGVRVEDREGQLLNRHEAADVATATGDWVAASVELGIPAGAHQACIEAWLSGQGTGWLDDVGAVAWSDAPGLDDAPLSDRGLENLVALGRLWTAVDLYYPGLDSADGVDWDATLAQAALVAEEAEDDEALVQVLRRAVAPLGGAVVVGEPDHAPPPPAVDVVAEGALHVVPGGDLPDLTGISAVFIDLRGGVSLPDDLAEHLISGAVGLPKVHRVRHVGYGRQEGLFERELVLEPAGEGFHGTGPTELAVYVLSDVFTTPEAGRGVMALHRSGRAVLVGAPVAAWPEAAHWVDLSPTVRARVPLAVYTQGGVIEPDVPCPGALALDVAQAAHRGEAANWKAQERPGLPSPGDAPLLHWQRHARFADTLVAWSLLDTFYPYWDAVEVDWDAALELGLRQAAVAGSPDAFARVLAAMVAKAGDGAAWVSVPGTYPGFQGPSLALDLVEGRVVVVSVVGSARDAGVEPGMELRTVDGRVALEVLSEAAAEEFASTDAARLLRALDWLLARPTGRTLSLELAHPPAPPPEVAEGAEAPEAEEPAVLAVELPPDRSLGSLRIRPLHRGHEDLGLGIHYVDLVGAEEHTWLERVTAVTEAEARAVIFDARGHAPAMERAALSVLPRKDRSLPASVAVRLGPGEPTGAVTLDRKVKARKPRLRIPAVFLADARTWGEAEAWLAQAQSWGARVVGAPTSGSVSAPASAILPAGSELRFSAVRSTLPDGSHIHGRGVLPDVEVGRTVAGVREGVDEVLEAAVALLRVDLAPDEPEPSAPPEPEPDAEEAAPSAGPEPAAEPSQPAEPAEDPVISEPTTDPPGHKE